MDGSSPCPWCGAHVVPTVGPACTACSGPLVVAGFRLSRKIADGRAGPRYAAVHETTGRRVEVSTASLCGRELWEPYEELERAALRLRERDDPAFVAFEMDEVGRAMLVHARLATREGAALRRLLEGLDAERSEGASQRTDTILAARRRRALAARHGVVAFAAIAAVSLLAAFAQAVARGPTTWAGAGSIAGAVGACRIETHPAGAEVFAVGRDIDLGDPEPEARFARVGLTPVSVDRPAGVARTVLVRKRGFRPVLVEVSPALDRATGACTVQMKLTPP